MFRKKVFRKVLSKFVVKLKEIPLKKIIINLTQLYKFLSLFVNNAVVNNQDAEAPSEVPPRIINNV